MVRATGRLGMPKANDSRLMSGRYYQYHHSHHYERITTIEGEHFRRHLNESQRGMVAELVDRVEQGAVSATHKVLAMEVGGVKSHLSERSRAR